MILLHTSDWHLGASDNERSLEEDQIFFIDAIRRIVKERGVDAVLIAGDIFDRSVASASAVRLYDEAMTKLCSECGVMVFLIAGNHDSAERLANCRDLLKRSGLYICGELSEDLSPVEAGGTQIFMLPWITEEKVRSVFPESKEGIGSMADAYRVVTDRMRSLFKKDMRHVIISHAYITDAETSESDRSAVIGSAAQVPASVFDGFDYAALGHIHKPQDVTGSVRYSGTPMPYSFGKEETQEKSVTLIDTDTMEHEVVPLPLLHRRKTFTGSYLELLDPCCAEEERLGYVRVQATDTYIGLEAMAQLQAVYPNLLEAVGKNFESEENSNMMTVEEFERIESDPFEIFRHFCAEVLNEEPDGYKLSRFADAVKQCEEKEG